MITEDQARNTAALLASVWNRLAQANHWHHRQSVESFMRHRKLLTTAVAGIAAATERRTPEHLVECVLSRWNWAKSPAPINMLANATQWRALAGAIAVENNELEQHQLERLHRVVEWVDYEWRRRTNLHQSQTPERTRADILEFAKVSRKIQEWSPTELGKFEEHLSQKT